MSQDHDKRLLTDAEWADLLDAEYQARGAPVDAVGRARVWRRLELERGKNKRKSARPWAALAAGLVAAFGIASLLRDPAGWRDKGDAATIPAALTPYVLQQDGATVPLTATARDGDTIVFRAHATRAGVYALVVRENREAPRPAIDEGGEIGAEEQLVTKAGSVYGIKVEPGIKTTVCLVVAEERAALRERLEQLSEIVADLEQPGCVSLEAP